MLLDALILCLGIQLAKIMIRNVSPNGQIEIVLTNTDKGLGLVIETTASNIYQGKAIAKYIEENYKC